MFSGRLPLLAHDLGGLDHVVRDPLLHRQEPPPLAVCIPVTERRRTFSKQRFDVRRGQKFWRKVGAEGR